MFIMSVLKKLTDFFFAFNKITEQWSSQVPKKSLIDEVMLNQHLRSSRIYWKEEQQFSVEEWLGGTIFMLFVWHRWYGLMLNTYRIY